MINDVNDNICFCIQDIMKGRRVYFDQFFACVAQLGFSYRKMGNTVIWDQIQHKGLFEGCFSLANDN